MTEDELWARHDAWRHDFDVAVCIAFAIALVAGLIIGLTIWLV